MVIAVCLCLRSVITSSQSNQTFGRRRKLSADRHRTFTPFLRGYALARARPRRHPGGRPHPFGWLRRHREAPRRRGGERSEAACVLPGLNPEAWLAAAGVRGDRALAGHGLS